MSAFKGKKKVKSGQVNHENQSKMTPSQKTKAIKVSKNIYEIHNAFRVRFNKNGVKVNQNFGFDPLDKGDKKKKILSDKERALLDAQDFQQKQSREIIVNQKSLLNTSELTLRTLLEQYLILETPKKKGAAEEKARIEALLRTQIKDDDINQRPGYPTKIADMKISKMTAFDIKDMGNDLLKNMKRSSSNKIVSLISSVLLWARKHNKEWAWITNVAEDCSVETKSEKKRNLTDQEIEDIVVKHTGSHALKMALILCSETGVRRKEVVTLEWGKHIVLESTFPYLFLADTKNGESRTVPLTQTALNVLLEVAPENRKGYLFPGETTTKGERNHMVPHSLTQAFSRARNRYLKEHPEHVGGRFHGTRGHFLSTNAPKVNAYTLALMSGHKTMNTILDNYYEKTPAAMATELGIVPQIVKPDVKKILIDEDDIEHTGD